MLWLRKKRQPVNRPEFYFVRLRQNLLKTDFVLPHSQPYEKLKQEKPEVIINIPDRLQETEKEFGKLSAVQKILLSTDGSVTGILDALHGKTQISVLEQKIIKADNKTAELLEINENDEVNYRVVLMHKDNLPLIHAESYTPLKRLSRDFKKELAASENAIGRILKKQNMEIRREILSIDIERGGNLEEIFKNCGPLLGRTYKIISGGKIFIWIKEIFSQHIY